MGYESFLRAQAQAVDIGRQRAAEAEQAQQRNILREAGQAYAGGDASGARNALLSGGMIDEGLQIGRADAQAQQQAREQELAARDRQQSALVAGAMGLRRLPQDQRWAVFQSRVLPHLQREGLGGDILGQITPDVMDDANLDSVIMMSGGEPAQPRYLQGPRGALDVIDPYSSELRNVRAPQREDAPNGYRWTEDGSLEPIQGGPADPRTAGALAASRRAPKSSGSSSRSRSSTTRPASAAPSTPPWERNW